MTEKQEQKLRARCRELLDQLYGGESAPLTVREFEARIGVKGSPTRWKAEGRMPVGRIGAVDEVCRAELGEALADELLEVSQQIAAAHSARRRSSRRQHASEAADLGLPGPAESWRSRLRQVIVTEDIEQWPVVATADTATLFRFGSDVTDGLPTTDDRRDERGQPRYVKRSVDDMLDRMLEAGLHPTGLDDRIIVVAGPPKSGKTRTVVEALLRNPELRAADLHLLRRPSASTDRLRNYAEAITAAAAHLDGPRVALIDDFHNDLGPTSVTVAVRSALRDIARTGTVVVVTTHAEPLDTPDPSRYGIDPIDHEWLRTREQVRVDSELDDQELADALETFGEVCTEAELRRLAERMAGVDELRRKLGAIYASTADPDAEVQAVLADALKDASFFFPKGIPESKLEALVERRWHHDKPGRPFPAHRWSGAVESLTMPIGERRRIDAGWAIAVFDPPGEKYYDDDLGRLRHGQFEGTYRLMEALSTELTVGHAPLPDCRWVADTLGVQAAFSVGKILWGEHDGSPADASLAWFSAAANAAHPRALLHLAEFGDPADSEKLLREALDLGENEAFSSLTRILLDTDRASEAIELLQTEAVLNNPEAGAALAFTYLELEGWTDKTERTFRDLADFWLDRDVVLYGLAVATAEEPELMGVPEIEPVARATLVLALCLADEGGADDATGYFAAVRRLGPVRTHRAATSLAGPSTWPTSSLEWLLEPPGDPAEELQRLVKCIPVDES